MSALKKPEQTPDESFITEAVRDGRCTQQDFSMKAIGTPDVGLQARVVHLDKNHCKRLDDARRLNGNLAPVVLFRDAKPNKVYLADGHHRHWVYSNANLPTIPAWVIDSHDAAREALEFATMCNREMCLGRTKDDLRQAVRMLLENETWWERADTWIGDHVGVNKAFVKTLRDRMIEAGKAVPSKIRTRDGGHSSYTVPSSCNPLGHQIQSVIKHKNSKHTIFRVNINGKTINLGSNLESAQKKLVSIESEIEAKKVSLKKNAVNCALKRLGFESLFGRGGGANNKYPGMQGWHKNGTICVACDFSSKNKLPMAVGSLDAAADILAEARGQMIAALYKKDVNARKIILCYPEDGPFYLMELYKAAGFEFMTPDQLQESLKTS